MRSSLSTTSAFAVATSSPIYSLHRVSILHASPLVTRQHVFVTLPPIWANSCTSTCLHAPAHVARDTTLLGMTYFTSTVVTFDRWSQLLSRSHPSRSGSRHGPQPPQAEGAAAAPSPLAVVVVAVAADSIPLASAPHAHAQVAAPSPLAVAAGAMCSSCSCLSATGAGAPEGFGVGRTAGKREGESVLCSPWLKGGGDAGKLGRSPLLADHVGCMCGGYGTAGHTRQTCATPCNEQLEQLFARACLTLNCIPRAPARL